MKILITDNHHPKTLYLKSNSYDFEAIIIFFIFEIRVIIILD